MASKSGSDPTPIEVDGLYENTDKKAVNDKYIELLQIVWFITNTIIRFRQGHNLSIDSILEDTNLSYILDNYEVDLTRDKIQSTETVIAVWLGGYPRTSNVRGNRIDLT